MERLSSLSPQLERLYQNIAGPLYRIPPYALGFPSTESQSAYYLGEDGWTQDEITKISRAVASQNILPQNTRLRKIVDGSTTRYEVLLASIETGEVCEGIDLPDSNTNIAIVRGDHSRELQKVCFEMECASKYARNDTTRAMLALYCESFQTGNLESYRKSQRTWIADQAPRVENIFGFVEPYRDPYGVRSEFECVVAINDPHETKSMLKLVEHSDMIIRRLPWAQQQGENNGKGPFEKVLFEPPNLTSIHGKSSLTSSMRVRLTLLTSHSSGILF